MKKFLSLLFVSVVLVSCGKQVVTVEPEQTPATPIVAAPTIVEPSTGFSFTPPVQPSIHGTREENNKILWKHIADSSNQFSIAHAKYVRVFLEKDLACDRDLLIGINGKSMGVLRQNLNCGFMNASQDSRKLIVFELDNVPVVQNGAKQNLNLFDYTNDDWELNLSFAVGQTDNFVSLIEVE